MKNHSGILPAPRIGEKPSLNGFFWGKTRAILLQKNWRLFFFWRIFFEEVGSVITMSACLPQNFVFWPLFKKVIGKND